MRMREMKTLSVAFLCFMGFGLSCSLRAEYKSPNWESIPYDANRTSLSAQERSQLSDALAEFSRSIKGEDAAADTLRAKALALALRLDPDNKSAVILNGKFKRGGYTSDGVSSISKDSLVKMFLMQTKKMQAETAGPDAVTAAYVLDFLAAVDSTNEDLLYQAEMAQRKSPVNWTGVLNGGGRARPSLTPGMTVAAPPSVKPLSDSTPVHTAPNGGDPAAAVTLKKQQSKVKGLVVMHSDDGVLGGKVMEVLATASSISGDSTCELSAKAAENMKIALSEAFRCVKMRHPEVARGIGFTLSFDDKYTKMAGGSAGTAFAVGLSAILDNLNIDPKMAMTGDITVDGKVRKVGGVPTKIWGAKLDGCELVGIPVENESDVANLMVMKGYRVASEIQIFSINTLDDAVSLARQDRPDKLGEAIKIFSEVQQDLNGNGSINSPEIAAKLDKILDLAPNHLSAKYLREKTRGTLATILTPGAAIDELFNAAGPLMLFFKSLDKEDRKQYRNNQILVFTLPSATYTGVRDQLTQLEKKMPPQIQSSYYAMVNLLDRVEYFDGQYKGVPHRSAMNLYNANFSNDLPRRTRVDDIYKQYQVLVGELTKLDYDKQFIEAQIH